MSNLQVAALIQNILKVVGAAMVGMRIGGHMVSAGDVQSILGSVFALVGVVWNHWQLALTKPPVA